MVLVELAPSAFRSTVLLCGSAAGAAAFPLRVSTSLSQFHSSHSSHRHARCHNLHNAHGRRSGRPQDPRDPRARSAARDEAGSSRRLTSSRRGGRLGTGRTACCRAIGSCGTIIRITRHARAARAGAVSVGHRHGSAQSGGSTGLAASSGLSDASERGDQSVSLSASLKCGRAEGSTLGSAWIVIGRRSGVRRMPPWPKHLH